MIFKISINGYKIITICILIYLFFCYSKSDISTVADPKNKKSKINHLIEENFFIIESSNLEIISSHMYGFSVSEKGIITDNYYKTIGIYEEPEKQGIYILIRRKKNIIKINQDYYGSYGIYIYENKNTGYFAFSNSFLLLVENLVGKQKMTFNEDFADNLIISDLCSPSTYETLIKEIKKIPPNSLIIIHIKEKKYEINFIDQKQFIVPFESEDGLKIIDKWVDKWGYIFRSLKKRTDRISIDLSGGFDSRCVFSVLTNSGLNLNDILIHSIHNLKEDFKIATNISSKFGLKLNDKKLDNSGIMWNIKNILDCSMYTKLGFHKEFHLQKKFFNNPKFSITGGWGGMLRGYPNIPIQKYIEDISSYSKKIKEYEKQFYNSSKKLLKRSINMLKINGKKNKNDYELSIELYLKGRGINHFGKGSVESFIANEYILEPLADPDLKKIKLDINEKSFHDLIAYIYVRFSHDLIYFPIQGKRSLNDISIKKAEKLNKIMPKYKIKNDYNKLFYIDNTRKSPISQAKNILNPNIFLKKLFSRKTFFLAINKKYNNSVYNLIHNNKKFIQQQRRDGYALLAIAIILDNLSINEKILKKRNVII